MAVNDIPPVTVTGNDNAVSIGQTGGITAHTYINLAPVPGIRVIEERSAKAIAADGTYTHSVFIQVVAGYAAENLIVSAKGPSVVGLQMAPTLGGPMSGGYQGYFGDISNHHHFYLLHHPVGKFTVDIKMSGPISKPDVVFQFNYPL